MVNPQVLTDKFCLETILKLHYSEDIITRSAEIRKQNWEFINYQFLDF